MKNKVKSMHATYHIKSFFESSKRSYRSFVAVPLQSLYKSETFWNILYNFKNH